MSTMRMVAEVGMDTTEAEGGLNRLDHMGERFSEKFSHHLSKAFGIGALAAGSVRTIEEVFSRAEEITKLAAETGRTTDEVQLLQAAAKEAGVTFEEYMERAKKGVVDLRKAVQEQREHGVSVIAASDIEALSKDKERLKGYHEGVVQRGATLGGTALGGVEALAHGRFGEAGLQAIRLLRPFTDGNYFGFNPYQWATSRLNPHTGGSGAALGTGTQLAMMLGASAVAFQRGRIDSAATGVHDFESKKALAEAVLGNIRADARIRSGSGYLLTPEAGAARVQGQQDKLDLVVFQLQQANAKLQALIGGGQ